MARLSRRGAILAGGAVGGALDLAFALGLAASHGVAPERVLRTIASGLLGQAAFEGSPAVAWLGVACHFALSLGWAGLFCAMALRWPVLLRRPWVSGPLFGVLVFLGMRLVVLPLSAFPRPVSFPPLSSALDLLSHMFLFGLPIAVLAMRARRR
ncbi:MAG TPA: hypothetical protein VGC74_03560 [Stenotrophomonas sp.]